VETKDKTVDEEVVATEEEDLWTWDPELDALLNSVWESSGQVTEEINTAWDKIEDAKEKIEAIQENPEAIDTDDLLKEIYEDLLQTETALQASRIAEDVARSKVSELQAQISNLEIDAAGQYQTDNPDLMIINKLMDAAQGWSDIALPKVKNALNKLYLWLFNSTIEEWQVKDNLKNVEDTWITLNEWTLPKGNNKWPEEPVDINDITSILW
jgi:chromosome segregation ATPase